MSSVVFNKIIEKLYVYLHNLLVASIINKECSYMEKILDFVWKTSHVEAVITKAC